MKKIDLELVQTVLQGNLELDVATKIFEQIQALQKEEEEQAAAEREQSEKVEKKFVALINDPTGRLDEVFEEGDVTGWVFQMVDSESDYTVPDKVLAAYYAFRDTKKGRKTKCENVADVCETCPPKFFRQQQLWLKTKSVVSFLRTDGTLPKEFSEKRIDHRRKD